MASDIIIGVALTKTVNEADVLDFDLEDTFTVDEYRVQESVIAAGAVDQEVVLNVSTLTTEADFILIETDQPITVKLENIANYAIEVNSVMVLSCTTPLAIYIGVPGATDATVSIFFGGSE